MTASTKSNRNGSLLARLIVSLTMGLMILALGASTAFAASGSHVTQATHNAAPIVSTGGGHVSLDEDDDDDDDEDDDEDGSGGGGLPATDTAPLAASSDSGAPMNALVLLVIAGLAGGAVTVAAKRSI
jgi:hypothetical protein